MPAEQEAAASPKDPPHQWQSSTNTGHKIYAGYIRVNWNSQSTIAHTCDRRISESLPSTSQNKQALTVQLGGLVVKSVVANLLRESIRRAPCSIRKFSRF